jgi:hypothetical protein
MLVTADTVSQEQETRLKVQTQVISEQTCRRTTRAVPPLGCGQDKGDGTDRKEGARPNMLPELLARPSSETRSLPYSLELETLQGPSVLPPSDSS